MRDRDDVYVLWSYSVDDYVRKSTNGKLPGISAAKPRRADCWMAFDEREHARDRIEKPDAPPRSPRVMPSHCFGELKRRGFCDL